MKHPIKSILITNRGEIDVLVNRATYELGFALLVFIHNKGLRPLYYGRKEKA